MKTKITSVMYLFIAVCMISIQNLSAQSSKPQKVSPDEKNPTQRIDKQLERLQKELELSPEQVNQIKPLIEERVKKRESIREANDKLHDQMDDLRELSKAQDEKLKTILSPEQFAKYNSRKEELKDRFRHRNRRGDRRR
ncbi:hypothetical protein [Arcicella rigui]|uniref:Periplasmic heavy metal sensor n=1 Tax=Arcicella rigui TaxID=797020 RepID=A0ABU5QDF5_9BACT|nr:hypothetical protein [Arcicella rigui]MEA5140861.1 hypothetical protein [Arcicella rigui]